MNKYFVLIDKDGNFYPEVDKLKSKTISLAEAIICTTYTTAKKLADFYPDFSVKELVFELKEPVTIQSSQFTSSEKIVLFSYKSFYILKYDFHSMATSVYYSIVREEWIKTTGINFSDLNEFQTSLEEGKKLLHVLQKPLYEEIKNS